MKFILRPEAEYLGSHLIDGIGCTTPFRRFEFNGTGDISICCASWLPVKCGNLLIDEYEEILNNATRISVLNDMRKGKITECNDSCTLLGEILGCSSSFLNPDKEKIFKTVGGLNRRFPNFVIPERIEEAINKIPYTIFFTYDPSCNLACPSCRPNMHMFKLNENHLITLIHKKATGFVDYLLNKGEKVNMSITGSGDPFGSPTFRNYLRELATKPVPENLELKLVTNGNLMTEQFMNEIKPLWKIISDITISIDAAREETYNIVRKNGNFTKLKENIDNLDNLISNGEFPKLSNNRFITHYVVQAANYREIKEYAEWQLSYKNSKCIQFALISQWGHISNEKFARMSKIDVDEIKEILKDPIFRNENIILGNLSYFLTS